MFIRFDHPEHLWLLLLAAPIVWLGVRSLSALEPVRRWTAIGLRLAVLLVLVCLLSGLQMVRWHDDLTVVAVIDESESVRRFGQPPRGFRPEEDGLPETPLTMDEYVRRYVQTAARQKKVDDRLGVVSFDSRPTVRALPSSAADLEGGALDQPRDGSDIAGGIRMAMAAGAQRIFLTTDGNETGAAQTGGSELLAAAQEAAAAGIPIDVLPIDYQIDREVMVEGVYAPSEAREGQTVALRVVLRATRPSEGILHVRHDGLPVDLNGDAPGTGTAILTKHWSVDEQGVGGEAGRHVCVRLVELPMGYAGANRFEAVFEPVPGSDTLPGNNRAESFTLVAGKGRVLVLDNVEEGHGKILAEALRSRDIEVEVVPGTGLPRTAAELQRYEAVILQNVPAEMITTAQQRMLAGYVNDMGGGLIMIGGPDSFAAGGWTNSPIDRILPVECQIPSQSVLPSGALVLVIDRSGSMAEGVTGSRHNRQEIANEAAVLAIATLYPQDMVGVVTFDFSAKWIVKLQPNVAPAQSAKLVRSIQPEGGTNIYVGLEQAYRALAPLKAEDAAVKHIILLTDGHSTEGNYTQIAKQMVAANITLSTVGVGQDVNATLLNQLAQMTGGNFYPILNANDLPQVFIKEARTIRKNLIKEITFQPRFVQTGSPIVAGMSGTPQLKGFVLTAPKKDPRVFTPLVGPENEPIFAHWQVGLGRTAAFTSDATNRWASPWLDWPGYSDFWARMVRAIARPPASRDYDLISTVRGDTLHLRLDATGGVGASGPRDTAAFANFLRVGGAILKPDGSAERVQLRQTGPGVYEASVPASEQGSYIVSLFTEGADGQRQYIFGGTSRPPGAELRNFRSNRAILEQVAQITGGRVLDPAQPEPGSLFRRESIQPLRSIRPVWWPLLAALLPLFLLDVAARRIAWDLRAIGQWFAQRARLTRSRGHEAAATLEALKRRAREVEQRTEPAAAPVESVAGRKFEATPQAAAADDFAAAVGGARAAAPPPHERGPAAPAATSGGRGGGQVVSSTSRLLDAKRRARQQLDDKS